MEMVTFRQAIRDGSDLVSWAEANSVALNDERVEAAVLRALSGPVPTDYAQAIPLLRFADTSVPPVVLLEAVMDDVRHTPTVCDYCEKPMPHGQRSYRLLIPAGASAVALHTDGHCHDVLNDVFACGLAWD